MKILLTIEYLGTNLHGWQWQPGLRTVQGELNRVLSQVCGHSVNAEASGRTDAGVHAMGQTAHFVTDCTIPAEKFPFACNILLPPDIKILAGRTVPDSFHARFDAKQKTYLYRMYLSSHIHPLRDALAYQVVYRVDVEKMRQAAQAFVGTHDFKSFQAEGNPVPSTVRTVSRADVIQAGDELLFEVTGNGFLYNMVRIMAGTLIDVGRGKLRAEDVPAIIESRDRERAGFTAPPQGLYLKSVEYPNLDGGTSVSSIL